MTEKIFSPLQLVELKRGVSDAGEFSAYVSTFGNVDRVNDVIVKGAFAQALDYHRAERSQPALLWGHDMSAPVGKWVSMLEDAHGLFGIGKLSLGVTKGAEAKVLLADSAVAFSIGFSIAPGGSYIKDGVRYITDIDRLHEASIVSVPANPAARLVGKQAPASARELEHLLREVGIPSRRSKAIVAAGWRGARDEQTEQLVEINDRLKHLESRLEKFL